MEFWVKGNIALRPIRLENAGDKVDGHEHNFDHVTYITRGAALVEKLRADGSIEKSVVKRAGEEFCFVLIAAGARHRITALEPRTMGHCIYAHRNPQGEVVLTYDGWSPAYE